MVDQSPEIAFGPYRLDAERRTLHHGYRSLDIGGRAMDILIALARAGGETVTQRDLLGRVWPGLTVQENNLHVQLSVLRKALGKDWIVTVPRHGYRLVGVTEFIEPRVTTPSASGSPVIAVLPFDNLSDDAKWDRLRDGLVDDIITGLARHPDLSVIARHSSFVYKGQTPDIIEIGRRLGARYLLDGTIQGDTERLRVTARLVDGSTGTYFWTERFDVKPSGLFATQDEVVDRVVLALVGPSGSISREALAGMRRNPPATLHAYELYLLGYEQEARLDREGTLASIGLLKTALAADPNYSRAWTVLAWAYGNTIQYRWTEDPASTRAQWHDAIRNAARTDPNDGLALVALVGMHLREGNRPAAILALQHAQTVGANQADVLPFLARHLCTVVDRPEEALAAMERGLVLNPHAPYWYFLFYCRTAYFARQYDTVLVCYERLVTDPTGRGMPLLSQKLFRWLALAQMERSVEADEAAAVLRASDPDLRQVSVDGADLSPGARQLFLDGLRKAGISEDLITSPNRN